MTPMLNIASCLTNSAFKCDLAPRKIARRSVRLSNRAFAPISKNIIAALTLAPQSISVASRTVSAAGFSGNHSGQRLWVA